MFEETLKLIAENQKLATLVLAAVKAVNENMLVVEKELKDVIEKIKNPK